MAFVLGLSLGACKDGDSETPMAPEPQPAASYDVTAQILGPVQNDDNADMKFTIQESKGIWGSVNFVRLTCSNGARQEWGADGFDDNRVPGGESIVFVRHYRCPSSGRPREVFVDLTDDSGFHHQVTAAPFHPDWPGA